MAALVEGLEEIYELSVKITEFLYFRGERERELLPGLDR